MSSNDNKKQSEKQKSTRAKHIATSPNSVQSKSGSKPTAVKTTRGSKGSQTGSRFAADPGLVDVSLDDSPPPGSEDSDWEVMDKPEHSACSNQSDYTRKYEKGIGKKDAEPNYEMVDKPEHSAYNGQGDHWRKYEGDEFVTGEPEPEKALWQRFSSLWK